MRFMMIGEGRGHKHAQGQKGKERHEMGYEGDVMSTSTGEMLEAVMETVENPPETWQPYLAKKDYRGIYEMESAELGRAFRASMEGDASMKDVAREMRHTFAAMLLWQAHKMHDEKE